MSSLSANDHCQEWKPLDIFRAESGSKFPLIILNQPLNEYGDVVLRLWKKACMRITTDGGTNQLYNLVHSMEGGLDSFLPDLITGDFDSITPDILKFYQDKGSTVIHTPDQDRTDFTKCLLMVLEIARDKNEQFDYIVVAVNNTGRFDHIMANINTLYLIKTKVPVYLLSKGSLTWLLQEGHHRIAVEENVMNLTCGLIPMGEPCCHVTTTGLQWNLNDQKLSFGGLMSTSNSYSENTVTITTDKPLLWTMEVK